jgi:hypothetical protein
MRCGASWDFPDALTAGGDWRFPRQRGLMNAVLLLKLFLVPLLIALVTLAGRRWGPGVAGWLSAFPVVAGPILFFIAVEQGASFAANAAVGTLSAVLAMLAFGISYAWAARRYNWPASLALAYAGYAAAVFLLSLQEATLMIAGPVVLVALLLAPRFYPEARSAAANTSKPANDMLLRMVAGATLVLLVTHFAANLGPGLSGVFAMFPVMGTVLVLFTHRSAGGAAATQLLRGMVFGFYAFSTFCVVLALALPATGIGMAFLCSVLAAGVVQALTRVWLTRHAVTQGAR